ncbi:hypothetical protein B0H17DRAFT_1202836 [Mycena rosella]|uniref:Uncharacterized protein n=1 Tax=Mycena rosella TaxID=1033263 RepID=A0AAD7GCY0_MYCRO|nr:hypothetical protein B0H17DRAFT_1202836 [Mycena rosella]
MISSRNFDKDYERWEGVGGPAAGAPARVAGRQPRAPSSALAHHGSKQRKIPNALTPGVGNSPGHLTPHSTSAQVDVPVRLCGSAAQHLNQQRYGRTSPMVSSVGAAPPAISNVRARGSDVGVSRGGNFNGQEDDERLKPTLLQVLTC